MLGAAVNDWIYRHRVVSFSANLRLTVYTHDTAPHCTTHHVTDTDLHNTEKLLNLALKQVLKTNKIYSIDELNGSSFDAAK